MEMLALGWMRTASSLLMAGAMLAVPAAAQVLAVHTAAGLQMMVDQEDSDPALRVVVPGGPQSGRSFKVLFPEHVTVLARGESEAKHLYLYRPGVRPGARESAPHWSRVGQTLEYTRDFATGDPGEIRFVARATLVADGIVFRYVFENRSATAYRMVTAITDPRFHTIFYDPRLERTFVYGEGGFQLLAAETPERLTMTLAEWFPVRYLASYTAPIPVERVQHRDDGITYRYRSRAVDVPMIATASADGAWVAASFARDPGNVWSNPELTCQHVDPDVPLEPHGRAGYEVKILIFRGSLAEALRKVVAQRGGLQ